MIFLHRTIGLLCLLGMLSPLFAETHVSGTIDSDTIWDLAGSPYIVDADLLVRGVAGPTLSIEAGVEVRFQGSTSLEIGHTSNSTYAARLIVLGTAGSPVVFTSDSVTPAPGDWRSITFQNHCLEGSLLEHCRIEYGGELGRQVWVRGGHPQILDCEIQFCLGHGVESYSTTDPVTVQNSTFSGCGGAAIESYPNLVRHFGPGLSIYGNGEDAILLNAGTIGSSCVWQTQNVPFHVLGDINIYAINGSAVLQVMPGNQLLFDTGGDLYVGNASNSGYRGGLMADDVEFAGVQNTAGSWNGIRMQRYTVPDSTILRNCMVRDGGTSLATGNFYVNNYVNNYVLEGCTFHNSAGYGLNDRGSDAGQITDCSFTDNAMPISIGINQTAWIRSGNSYSGNADNRIEIRSGTLKQDATWVTQDVPFVMSGTSYIYNNVNASHLTLSHGSIFEFKAGGLLRIGSSSNSNYTGSLEATGVTFRGESHSPGFWNGIFFDAYANPSVLNGCTVEDAGNGQYGLYVNSANHVITGCTIQNGLGDGMYATNANPPEISATTITGCSGFPLSVFVNDAGAVLPGNSFTGNAVDKIEVRSGSVSTSAIWANPGVPYSLTGSSYIQGTASPLLQILPGTVVQIPANSTLQIGSYTNSTYTGALLATGVTFESPEPGNYFNALYFGRYATHEDCLLQDCTVQRGGATASWGGIRCYANSSPTLENVTIRDCNSHGLLLSANAKPTVNNCDFADNAAHPVSIAANDLLSLGSGNTYTDNSPNRIKVLGDMVTESQTWQDQGIPLEITGDISVSSNPGTRLILENGCRLEFNSGTRLTIGSSHNSSYVGGLTASGASFSGSAGMPGSWEGIYFSRYLEAAESVLDGCVVEHGGEGTPNANVLVYYSTPRISGCLIQHSDENGVRIQGADANPIIQSSTFQGQTCGIKLEASTQALIGGAAGNGNSLAGNTTWGVNNLSSHVVDATWNWWGDASGPSGEGPGTGDAVSVNVLFDPWRMTALGDAPANFDLMSPAFEDTLGSLFSILDWEDALDPSPGDTVRYRLELSLDPAYDPEFVTTIDSLLNSRYQTQLELVDDTQVWWRVTAFDEQEQETNSNQQAWSFHVFIQEAPAAPQLQIPATGETVLLTSILLDWDESLDPDPGDSVNYRVYLAPTAAFADADSVDTHETGVFTPFCTPDAYRYWKVRAIDQTGRSTESEIRNFFVDASAGPRPILDLHALAAGDDIELSWDAIPGADLYHVSRSAIAQGPFVEIGDSVLPGYVDPGVAQSPARLFYQVTADDQDLQPGLWRNLAGEVIR